MTAAPMTADGGDASMMPGFGNHFSTEAVAGALPIGRNAPQRPPLGLYAEQVSGTAFTAPRADQRRSWLYRIRPAAAQAAFVPMAPVGGGAAAGGLGGGHHRLAGGGVVSPNPNRLRWDAPAAPDPAHDFVDGLTTMMATPGAGAGLAVHLYAAGRSMERVFFDADGELLIIPQAGGLRISTELGRLEIAPGMIALLPRGLRFRVELTAGPASGYVAENFGQGFRLPELGPIGSNGLANPRDFLTPRAWFEDVERPVELVQKFGGRLWSTMLDHSPLDVVAWHGSYAPCCYDLARFNTINTVSFDHPDPSIFTVLTSPGVGPGIANCDFVVFPPRWMVAEGTFRPPWFHRNVMNECMGLIRGAYDAKADGFVPGGISLHPCMNAHGPDADTTAAAMAAELVPVRFDDGLAFMVETHDMLVPTELALASPTLQPDYDSAWHALPRLFGRG